MMIIQTVHEHYFKPDGVVVAHCGQWRALKTRNNTCLPTINATKVKSDIITAYKHFRLKHSK